MEPHRTAHGRAIEWLLEHLESVEQDPDVLASMPLGDVLEGLQEGDTHGDVADHQAALQRIEARFASPKRPELPDRPARPPARRRRRARWAALAVGAGLVALGIMRWAGPVSLSETERLVGLDTYTAEIDDVVDRPTVAKAPDAGWAELEAGWAALQRARREVLGLFPLGYDDEAARQSIEHLEAAYRYGKSARSGRTEEKALGARALPPQGLVAFLAAQAYLLLEDTERARFWLQTATGYDDEPWRSAARILLDQLPPLE